MKQALRLYVVLTCTAAVFMGICCPLSAAENVVKMNIPCHINPKYQDLFPDVQRFVDRINELGKGKIEAKLYHSETFLKVKDIVPALMKGGCDIIFHTSSHTTGFWPELGGLSLPFLYKDEFDCRDKWMAGAPLFDLINKEMDKKYGVRILSSGILKGIILATRQKPVEKPEDLNGLILRSAGKSDAEFIKNCGAKPVFLSSSEASKALRMGALDGLVTYPGTIVARNIDEFLDYIIDTTPLFNAWGYQIYVLNKTFNSWSKEVQDIVLQAAKEYDQQYLENSVTYYNQNVKPRLEKKMKFISPAPEQMKKFTEIAHKTYDEWLKTVDNEFGKKFIELSQMP